MEDLEVMKGTTLYLPDKDNDIGIEIDTDFDGTHIRYVQFEVLEKWVTKIRYQINKGDLP